MKNTYYFTYGSDGLPYKGGWTEVIAESFNKAVELFNLAHPRKSGLVNCAGIYTEAEFQQTQMFKTGKNFGVGCREIIDIILPEGKSK